MSAAHSSSDALLVPVGEHENSNDGGVIVQVIDSASVAAMAAKFQPKILVDQEHFSYDVSKSSEAMGWLVSVKAQPDGLHGRIEWTDKGTVAVENCRYRFLSPVFAPRDLQPLGKGRARPLRIHSVGLTNKPNIGAMPPLMNRVRGNGAPATSRPARPELISSRVMPQAMRNCGSLLTRQDIIASLRRCTGMKFDEIWATSGPLLNHFANRHATVASGNLWAEAQAKEKLAFDKTWDSLARSDAHRKDRGVALYKKIIQPPTKYPDAVRVLMEQQGMDFAHAWEHLRETEPVFWLRHVLGMADPSDVIVA